MKMNRAKLKALIKECLVEILNEGLGGAISAPTGTQTSLGRQTMADSRRSPAPLPERRVVANTAVQREAVKIASAGNPILESIMADTMQTTYVDQYVVKNHSTKTGVEAIVDESTPEEMFGESASKWLAIMDRVGVD